MLNIKNPETHKLASEIARLTGESLTTAVTVALRERLRHLDRETRLDRVKAISHDCAQRLKAPWTTVDHAMLLYDEHGLPK